MGPRKTSNSEHNSDYYKITEHAPLRTNGSVSQNFNFDLELLDSDFNF
jgi:hypothetical protein